jgi:hypothetical protein
MARETYQIIREGLANAARYAHATVVQVDLKAYDHSAFCVCLFSAVRTAWGFRASTGDLR